MTKEAAEADEMIRRFGDYQKSLEQHMNEFHAVVVGLSNGSVSEATAYNDLEEIHSSAMTFYSKIISFEVPDRYNEDKKSLLLTASYFEHSITEFRSFLDDKKTSTMAEAQKDLEEAIKGNHIVTMAVAQQAIKDGWRPPEDKKGNH